LNQTYKNYEVYFVDDESTDNTFSKVTRLTDGDTRFKIIRNAKNMGGTYNHLHHSTLELKDDNTIICLLDGDDWLYDITVLEKLNEFYNRFDVWMTYGGMIVYTDNGLVEANPQNSHYPDEVHMNKSYRQDVWRASHLRTYRAYLWKSVDTNDMRELENKNYYSHAGDLALQFPCLEMCPKEKIGVVPFQTYVYNATQKNTIRTSQRQMDSRHWDIENEIRNRKPYNEKTHFGK
jgi:glycosyltransferase involved in cell wall biosynthesis